MLIDFPYFNIFIINNELECENIDKDAREKGEDYWKLPWYPIWQLSALPSQMND